MGIVLWEIAAGARPRPALALPYPVPAQPAPWPALCRLGRFGQCACPERGLRGAGALWTLTLCRLPAPLSGSRSCA